jgi:hypothetical protein
MDVQRIDDVTLEHISSDGSGTAPDLADIARAAITRLRAHEPFVADALAGMVDAAINGTAHWLSLEDFAREHGLPAPGTETDG